MTDWAAALTSIAAAFADQEPIAYTQEGVVIGPISAIRSDERAPSFEGVGATLRRVTYEVPFTDLPARPANGESFTHRGRRWRVLQVEDQDEVGAWLLTVSDAGAAA